MSEHTPITGELREAVEWEPTFCGPDKAMVPQPEFDRICDAIDAVHAQLERENAELRERVAVLDNERGNMHDGWVRLPLDADGEYIHVGDVLDGYGKTIEVVEMRYGRSGWVLISRDGNGYADCAAFVHHHDPTVEDVLREMLYKAHIYDKREMELLPDLIAEYAAKLRLAGSDAE